MTIHHAPPRDFARRRENRARKTLRRIDRQRKDLAQRYSDATTPRERLRLVTEALMAAAVKHPNIDAAADALDRVIEVTRRELATLHNRQAAEAEHAIAQENLRRKRRDAGTTARRAS